MQKFVWMNSMCFKPHINSCFHNSFLATDSPLKQHPLQWLRSCSLRRLVVAVWVCLVHSKTQAYYLRIRWTTMDRSLFIQSGGKTNESACICVFWDYNHQPITIKCLSPCKFHSSLCQRIANFCFFSFLSVFWVNVFSFYFRKFVYICYYWISATLLSRYW